jgi:enamine deaminase RidA (YjgF/YER057c/UK114 family)
VTSLSERLAALGIELPEVAAPIASYVPAVRTEQLVFTSGQLPFVAGELLATGKVGREVDVELAIECARVCALNGLAAAHSVVGMDNVVGVLKVVAYVAAVPDFVDHATVTNGASDLLGTAFGQAGAHARTSIGVATLPLNAPIEIEFTFAVR